MDISVTSLHYPCMDVALSVDKVPDYRLYRERRGEASDFWLHCEPIPDRTRLHRFEIAAHRHPALFQMFRITDGEGEIVDGKTIQAFAAPCVLLIPPGAVHGFRFSKGVDGVVVTALADRLAALTASDRQIARFAREVRIVPAASGEAEDCVLRIDREMKASAAGRTRMLEALVAQAVVELARAWLAVQPADGKAERLDASRIERLETLVSAHFREARPVSFYAARLGVSTAQLNRITRAETGQSVQGLIAARIVEAARRDLVFTPTPVNRIAESLGFADPAYFNRFFRRQVGVTPGAFREGERARLETA
jgi:AraC family transcriptional activator of pobA